MSIYNKVPAFLKTSVSAEGLPGERCFLVKGPLTSKRLYEKDLHEDPNMKDVRLLGELVGYKEKAGVIIEMPAWLIKALAGGRTDTELEYKGIHTKITNTEGTHTIDSKCLEGAISSMKAMTTNEAFLVANFISNRGATGSLTKFVPFLKKTLTTYRDGEKGYVTKYDSMLSKERDVDVYNSLMAHRNKHQTSANRVTDLLDFDRQPKLSR